jgi:GAF domain-containing protein
MSERTERILEARNHVLERIAQGADLDEVLEILCTSSETVMPGVLCSVLLLDDDGRLRHGCAPSLPKGYVDAIDGLTAGPGQGSCGTAAFTGERVIVEDVLEHPFWERYRGLARAAEVRACWSEPIRSSKRVVLGTFAMYYRTPRAPDDFELEFIKRAAYIAGIAIERTRTEAELARYREHLEELVERRSAEVRMLRGLLPICAWCKRIRDDDGGWADLGRYLQKHGGAEVTHGICPDCAAGLHPPRL